MNIQNSREWKRILPPASMIGAAFSLLVAILISSSVAAKEKDSTTIGYLTMHGRLTAEDSAAVAWLTSSGCGRVVVLDISAAPLEMSSVDVAWIHIPDSADYPRWEFQKGLLSLRRFYLRGGKLLFTGVAAVLPRAIGIESSIPQIRSENIQNDWLFDEKGIQGFRGHPAFDGLFGGTFLWDTDHDNTVYRAGYFGRNWPREGKVIGIEKSYVSIDSDTKLMIEYNRGKGRAIAIGGFVLFREPNSVRSHVERFLHNIIEYLKGVPSPTKRTYWPRSENRPRRFSIESRCAEVSRWPSSLPSTELLITRPEPRDNFYDLAGRRALVMGREHGGIDEFWVHPFRVLRDFRTALVLGDSVRWLDSLPVSIAIRPESITRTYASPAGSIEEIVFAALDHGASVVRYKVHPAPGSVSLLVTWRCDLRFMWPYDERALGDLYYGYDDSLGALHVKDVSGNFYCMIGADRRPVTTLDGQFSSIRFQKEKLRGITSADNQVYHGAMYDIGRTSGGTMTFVLAGSDGGREETESAYRALLNDPAGEYSRVVHHNDDVLHHMVTITSPDPEFNALWKWTLVGVDRFVTTTPGLGTALVAGYSTVDRGWDGGQKISGRPGYAWYFGRDAEWSGFAIDDYGDFPAVKSELEFLRKFQDLSGKILHEMSTSGVVHYDAADATPLYVVLAAHYLRASGDTAFIRDCWPSIRRAMDFLSSTDTDGDGLIENTNVGHGWVEGGRLWPPHTEFYLGGIWGQALADASWMASRLGSTDLAARYGRDAESVKKYIDTGFWNVEKGCYNFSKRLDGTFNSEPTVLPAPVMYFGWLNDGNARENLKLYAGNSFTTNWGVRILRGDSPLYDPRGYHSGAVWPLFTGWTALAEYEYGNSTQAFSHILDNVYLARYWEAGFVQEVMNGSMCRPSGVCPHQCWSETNIIHPGIHGMIGWRPNAVDAFVELKPRFPLGWSQVSVDNLRIGPSVVGFTMHRSIDSTSYRLILKSGPPVRVKLAPEIPAGMSIRRAWLDGMPYLAGDIRSRGLLDPPVEIALSDSANFSFRHSGGIGMVPTVPGFAPGDSAVGLRIVSSTLVGKEYDVELEGKPGDSVICTAMVFDSAVKSVEGASLLPSMRQGEVRMAVSFDRLESPVAHRRIVIRLGGG